MESGDGLFGRIVYLLSSKKSAAMKQLRSEVMRINAWVEDLDLLSGFHVVDEQMHIVVLE